MNKELIGAKANLSFYIEQDPFFNGTYEVESDFDKYCYEHCKDIETVLSELEQLQDDLKIHEETSFEFQEENIKLRKELENSIPRQVILDKLEELKKVVSDYPETNEEIREKAQLEVLKEILKGENNENI